MRTNKHERRDKNNGKKQTSTDTAMNRKTQTEIRRQSVSVVKQVSETRQARPNLPNMITQIGFIIQVLQWALGFLIMTQMKTKNKHQALAILLLTSSQQRVGRWI